MHFKHVCTMSLTLNWKRAKSIHAVHVSIILEQAHFDFVNLFWSHATLFRMESCSFSFFLGRFPWWEIKLLLPLWKADVSTTMLLTCRMALFVCLYLIILLIITLSFNCFIYIFSIYYIFFPVVLFYLPVSKVGSKEIKTILIHTQAQNI